MDRRLMNKWMSTSCNLPSLKSAMRLPEREMVGDQYSEANLVFHGSLPGQVT